MGDKRDVVGAPRDVASCLGLSSSDGDCVIRTSGQYLSLWGASELHHDFIMTRWTMEVL